MTALIVWVLGLLLNCVAVALVGPWAMVATIGGALIAAGTLSGLRRTL